MTARLDRVFADFGGIAGVNRLLRYAKRRGAQKPPAPAGKPLEMPRLFESGKGKRK